MSINHRKLEYEYLPPDPRLNDSIAGYFQVSDFTSMDKPLTDKTFPSYSESLVFQFGRSMTATSETANFNEELCQCYALGPNKSPISLEHNAGLIDTMLVRFKIGGFYHLFGIPGAELVDDIMDFDLWGKRPYKYRPLLDQLSNDLSTTKSPLLRKQLLDNFFLLLCRKAELMKRYRNYESDRERLQYFFALLHVNTGGIGQVGDFAGQLYTTAKTLNRLTQKFTGSTAKQIAKYWQMMSILQFMDNNRAIKATDITNNELFQNSHYHLKKDFKKYTGEDFSSYLHSKYDVAQIFLRSNRTVGN